MPIDHASFVEKLLSFNARHSVNVPRHCMHVKTLMQYQQAGEIKPDAGQSQSQTKAAGAAAGVAAAAASALVVTLTLTLNRWPLPVDT